jgi:regulatory protein YycH of two-component signal transduction system YycFG
MMPLAIIGLVLMSALIAWGVWSITKSITVKKTTERYKYVKAKDEDGNEITKVIDLEDTGNE